MKYTIGEVSTATEYPDLVPDLMDELRKQVKGKRGETAATHRELLRDIQKRINHKYPDGEVRDYYDDGDVERDIDDLVEALDYYSAPYFRFCAREEGNSMQRSVYGYWQNISDLEDFDGLKVNDTSDIPAGYRGEVLHVNDHGNMTLYVKTARKLIEVWGVV